MKYRTIKSVALDLCALHLGDPEGNKEALAIRAIALVMDELSLHINANIVSEKKVIGANFTIQMPESCIDVLKVGVVDNGGRIRIMGRDERIRREVPEVAGCSCGNSETQTDEECSACCFHNLVDGNFYKGELYGYKPVLFKNGTFRYNEKQNRLEFASGYDVYDGAEVLVEYRAALGGNEYNLIPSPFALALIRKAAAEIDTRNSERHMREFNRAYSAYKQAIVTYNEHDLLAALKGEMMSAVKF